MKISIIGDCHCGFDFGGERSEDTFVALEEAVNRSLDADLVIQVGDLFDSRIMRQEVFARVARTLGKLKAVPCSTKLLEFSGKDEVSPSALLGVPVIVVHGNHERRSRNLVNPVQALDSAGLVLYLDGNTVVFEVEGRKVAVHGMSAVPERYAKDFLFKWAPKPVVGAINILVLHQSIDPYIYSPFEPPSLKLEELPPGFDLVTCGHMHWHDHRLLRGSQFLLTGSLASTAMHKNESQQKKGFWTFDGTTVSFNQLQNQRRVYWEDFEYSPSLESVVQSRVSGILSENHVMKPVVHMRLHGKLPAGGVLPSVRDFERRFGDKVIFRLASDLDTEVPGQAELLKSLRHSGLSAEEQGLKLLQACSDNMKCAIKVDEVFDLLVDGRIDDLFRELSQGAGE